MCISKPTIIGLDHGILFIRTLATKLSEMLCKIHTFSVWKIHLKTSSTEWRQLCLGLNVLKWLRIKDTVWIVLVAKVATQAELLPVIPPWLYTNMIHLWHINYIFRRYLVQYTPQWEAHIPYLALLPIWYAILWSAPITKDILHDMSVYQGFMKDLSFDSWSHCILFYHVMIYNYE